MMPVVRISDATLGDVKVLSKWLETKTPAETIEKMVETMMDDYGLERDGDLPHQDAGAVSSGSGLDPMRFTDTPGLSFTKLKIAKVNGRSLDNPKWGMLLIAVVAELRARAMTPEDLVRELNINARVEESEDHGYRYHPELGISVQGQSAPDAWREASRLANKWRIPVEVEFEWRDNPKAQYPGKRGELRAGQ